MTAHQKFRCLSAALLLAFVGGAEAQQSAKIPTIGVLMPADPSSISTRIEAFRDGLRDLGYIEKKNIIIEWRSGNGNDHRLPALAAELMRLNVHIIVTTGPGATRSAKNEASTIPIIMANDSDPVGNKFVDSLARPGGNITGLSTLAPDLSGKQLELLKEITPKLSRVAVLGSSSTPGNIQSREEVELAASALKLRLQYFDVLSLQDIELAFLRMNQTRAEAVVAFGGPVLLTHRKEAVEHAAKNRLPTIWRRPEFVEDGGLMTYGVSINDLFRRAALYVDKILKGAKPAELPVEQPRKFELVINLNAAKQIGLTIPPNVLARADRVIK